MKPFLSIFLCNLLLSCGDGGLNKMTHILQEMEGKQIYFPNDMIYTLYGKVTLDLKKINHDYTMVFYFDSLGCASCKIPFSHLKNYIHELDSLSNETVLFRIIFHPQNESELVSLLEKYQFSLAVCIDNDEAFNKKNKLHNDQLYHTFLLDKNDRIIAVGDPISNPKIRELYHKIIVPFSNFDSNDFNIVEINQSIVDFGMIDNSLIHREKIEFENISNRPLIVNNVISSCGCLNFEYSKKPIKSGNKNSIIIDYKPNSKGYFNKTVDIYFNNGVKPTKITVKGFVI